MLSIARETIARIQTVGTRVRLTCDLSRYDDRLTGGQLGTVRADHAIADGAMWERSTGTPFVHVVFDCGAALDVIVARWKRPTKREPNGAWLPAGLELVEVADTPVVSFSQANLSDRAAGPKIPADPFPEASSTVSGMVVL